MGTMDLETYFYAHLKQLQELIQIPSVYDKASVTPDMPYGKGVAAALEYMRQLAYQDGFEVLEYDGRAIGIRVTGAENAPGRTAKNDRVDIASHLDVVEPGDGWTVDPFGAVIRDGKLYGRGSQDMKTSAFLTYLALKKLKEEGFPFQRELRIVLGCDEERTMEDMIYYVEKAGLPAFAFTPDGVFPMSIGEKGALMWRLSGSYEGPVEELDCGVQCNVISPKAMARCRGDWQAVFQGCLEEMGIDGCVERMEDGSTRVRVNGVAAHASQPQEGHSATVDLLRLLGRIDPVMENLYQSFRDPYGSQLGVMGNDFAEDPSEQKNLAQDLLGRGTLEQGTIEQDILAQEQFTMNLGILRLQNGEFYGEVDGRYPFGMTSEDLTERLARKCALKVSLDYDSVPTMNQEEDPFVKILLDTYREQTGDMSRPVVSGGVSYSKVFGHCVAYGPVCPWMDMLAHQADEYVRLEDCVTAFRIYYEAMKRLAQIKSSEG